MEDVKKMFLKYADDEFKASLEPVQGPLQENENALVVEQSAKFKYVDGVYTLSNMPLPGGELAWRVRKLVIMPINAKKKKEIFGPKLWRGKLVRFLEFGNFRPKLVGGVSRGGSWFVYLSMLTKLSVTLYHFTYY